MMVDDVGLELDWAADGTLAFGVGVSVDEAFTRPLSRLRPVALDPEACTPPERIQYWMYNGVATVQDRARLAATGMRYELTLMAPLAIGRERAKTLGHLHSFPPNSALNYPEVCEVLHGTAIFLFQCMNVELRSVSRVIAIEARQGDKVVIPPNVHHLTINSGDEPLLFSDIIPLAVSGNYEPFAQMGGAGYFYLSSSEFVPNERYAALPTLEHRTTRAYPDARLTPHLPLYTLFSEAPEALSWMLEPERFAALFPDLTDLF